jgi:hypothetical protein
MVGRHRSSSNDAIRQRFREFEREVEYQGQVIAREAQERAADIERAATEQFEMLDSLTADKTAEIHWAATEQRKALDQAAEARLAQLERAARDERAAIANVAASQLRRIESQAVASRDAVRKSAAQEAAAFEELASTRFVALENDLRAEFRALRHELLDEARRIRDAAVERIDQARSLLTPITVLDKFAGERAFEFQEAVRKQTDLLDEITRLHVTASEQLDKARALTAADLRSGIEGLGRDILSALQQIGAAERAKGAAAAPEVSRPAVPVESSLFGGTLPMSRDEAETPPIHWTAPPAAPIRLVARASGGLRPAKTPDRRNA